MTLARPDKNRRPMAGTRSFFGRPKHGAQYITPANRLAIYGLRPRNALIARHPMDYPPMKQGKFGFTCMSAVATWCSNRSMPRLVMRVPPENPYPSRSINTTSYPLGHIYKQVSNHMSLLHINPWMSTRLALVSTVVSLTRVK